MPIASAAKSTAVAYAAFAAISRYDSVQIQPHAVERPSILRRPREVVLTANEWVKNDSRNHGGVVVAGGLPAEGWVC